MRIVQGRGTLPPIVITDDSLAAIPDALPRAPKRDGTKSAADVIGAMASATAATPHAFTLTVARALGTFDKPESPVTLHNGRRIKSTSRYRQWSREREYAYGAASAQAATPSEHAAITAAIVADMERGPDWLRIRRGSKLNWLPDIRAIYTTAALKQLKAAAERLDELEYQRRCKANAEAGRTHAQRRRSVGPVLDYLIDLYTSNAGYVFPTRKVIAGTKRLGVRTVDAALRWLEGHGFVIRTRRRAGQLDDGTWREHQTSNVYELVLPPAAVRRAGLNPLPPETLTRPAPPNGLGQGAVIVHQKTTRTAGECIPNVSAGCGWQFPGHTEPPPRR